MRVGVVGGGTVGRAVARSFIEHVDEVRVYDVVRERRTHPLADVLGCDLAFVCLPTPQQEGGLAADLTAVEGFFGRVPRWPTNFVLRSTVPVGTTRRLRETFRLPSLVHSPEFLTARCAVTDAQLPARNVIGGERCDAMSLLEGLYRRRFPGVPVHLMSSDESEAVKLFQNGFFSTAIAYWNEVYTFAEKLGLDWDVVMAAVLADGRISHSHTRVPGPDGRFGFGGSCLPKDLASLVHQFADARLGSWVTSAAHARNREDRRRA